MKNDSAIRKSGQNASAANQDFHATVGSVAGRDSIDHSEQVSQTSAGDGAVNVNNVDTVTVVQLNRLLTSLAESTLQSNFYAETGMRCTRHVRQQMEMLMEKHGFHYHELARAWNTHTIFWDAKRAQLSTAARGFDLMVGWGGLVFSAVMFTILMVDLFTNALAKRGTYNNVAAIVVIFGFLGAVAYFIRSHLHPQQVAKRVERALNDQAK